MDDLMEFEKMGSWKKLKKVSIVLGPQLTI